MTTAAIDKASVIEFLSRLEQEGYTSLTLRNLRATADAASPSSGDTSLAALLNPHTDREGPLFFGMSKPIGSDILLPNERCAFHVCFYTFTWKEEPVFFCEANALYRADERPAAIESFCSKVIETLHSLAIVKPDAEFNARESKPPEMPEIVGLETAQPPDRATLVAARELADANIRVTLIDIKRAALGTVDELVKGRARAPRLTLDELTHLVDSGLLRIEYAVLCKGTSHRVYATQSRNEVLESRHRCLQCGRSIASHDIAETVVTTSLSDDLLLKSRWMRILVVDTLMAHGLPSDQILVPPADSASDDIDLAFLHEGSFIISELKDNDFGRGDASNFAVRIKQIDKATDGLVVVTGSVDEEARRALVTFFPSDRTSSLIEKTIRIHILEGTSSFDSGLREFLTERQISSTIGTLRLYGPCAGLDIGYLIRQKLEIT